MELTDIISTRSPLAEVEGLNLLAFAASRESHVVASSRTPLAHCVCRQLYAAAAQNAEVHAAQERVGGMGRSRLNSNSKGDASD